MFKRFGLGITSYFEAHRLVVKHKLWGYMLIPGIINVILFTLFIWGVFTFASFMASLVLDILGLTASSDGFLGVLKDIIYVVVSLLVKISLLLIYYSVYKYIILILLSPILGMLSERTERILTGKDFDTTPLQFVKDFVRGLKLTLRNFLIEITCTIIAYLLVFIPIVNLFIPLVLFFISSYFMGFSMIDYTNERHKLSIPQSLQFMRNNKGAAIGTGFIFNLLFLIPFVGWLIAPGYSVIAATITTHKIKNNLV